MKRSEIQQRIYGMYDDEAHRYEAAEGHGILTAAEKEAWRSDILSLVDFPAGSEVLEVGAGTGVFSRLLAEWGCQVVGIDSSTAMLTEAVKRLPSTLAYRIDFRLGDTHHLPLFTPRSFAWIVGRYVANHLYDPLAAFHNWREWLRDDGSVLIVEGLWPREDWEDDELVDSLPLSCLQTRATVGYLLEKAGFTIRANYWLESVNAYLESIGNDPIPLYAVVARKQT